MVAKITTPHRISAALNYNENKVSQGKAECLYAANYLREANAMNFYQKLEGFERLNELNDRATTKTLHVSLNFDPSEKLSNDKLVEIASVYMDKIGFGEQPFLVYKHQDAGHPHIHIVTNTIREDGSRINTHNIGRNQSEKARKEIEKDYGLVRAESQKQLLKQPIRPVNNEKINYGKTETKKSITNVITAVLNTYKYSSLPEFNAILKQPIRAVNNDKIIYGKTETKKSITNVVTAVLNTYKYASLPEFNAILKQYNVIADRGKEDGRIYKHRGLIYRVLDAKGNKIGVPIKASSINCQPTLDKLEKLFQLNETKKEPFKQHLKAAIDEAVAKQPASLQELTQLLAQKNIYTVLRQNTDGRIYGITFVDNQNKTVFNGSDLGKPYSAGHLQDRILSSGKEKQQQATGEKNEMPGSSLQPLAKNTNLSEQLSPGFKTTTLIDVLLSQEKQDGNIPYQLLKKKRKRKKRSLGL